MHSTAQAGNAMQHRKLFNQRCHVTVISVKGSSICKGTIRADQAAFVSVVVTRYLDLKLFPLLTTRFALSNCNQYRMRRNHLPFHIQALLKRAYTSETVCIDCKRAQALGGGRCQHISNEELLHTRRGRACQKRMSIRLDLALFSVCIAFSTVQFRPLRKRAGTYTSRQLAYAPNILQQGCKRHFPRAL